MTNTPEVTEADLVPDKSFQTRHSRGWRTTVIVKVTTTQVLVKQHVYSSGKWIEKTYGKVEFLEKSFIL